MKKSTNKIILAIVLLLCLAAPLASIWIDFGGGTDDAACEVIEGIAGPEPAMSVPAIGYEPSDEAEPWLFVLQVAIGITIFAVAYALLKRKTHDNVGQ